MPKQWCKAKITARMQIIENRKIQPLIGEIDHGRYVIEMEFGTTPIARRHDLKVTPT